jgi:hypothetical protein
MTTGNLLCADPAILQVYEDAQEYAITVNTAIAQARDGRLLYPFCGGALYALTADLLAMHRAVLSLCAGGWAFTAVCLHRSMLDLLMNAAVMTEQLADAEYRGFKYTHFFLKAEHRAPGPSPEARASVRPQIEAGIGKLPANQRQKAKDFMFRVRMGGYWYWPEYKSPADVLDRLSTPEIKGIYDALSGGAHGGFIGLRIFKDDPDLIHPNPRADRRAQNMALGGSTRILLEAMNIRDRFENDGVHLGIYRVLIAHLSSLRAT